MKRFFKGSQFIVTKATTRAEVERQYKKTIDEIKGAFVEAWDADGSGWEFDRVESSYLNTSVYAPVAGSSYIPLLRELAAKTAIINVKNRDNECLRWALKSALFPVSKDAQRTSKYPQNDGLNWEGIEFPVKVSQISKLEK